ncbi:MAG: hypothetical protein MJ248_05295 [Bacilli bacterium]|nr:hypothetical protein [Bacilli bacterium]
MKKACTTISLIVALISIFMFIFCLAYKTPVTIRVNPWSNPSVIGYEHPLALWSIYFAYALITSIVIACAVNSSSKKVAVVAGIFYIPVMLVVSILAFFIPSDEF